MSIHTCTNIASYLPVLAKQQPDIPAIIFPEENRTLTYSELDAFSDRLAHGLSNAGVCRGVRTVLMVTPGPLLFALTFALFKNGAVPVLIDPGLGVKNIKSCIRDAEPTAFIGIPKAHLARILFGWGKENLEILVTAGKRMFWGGLSLEQLEKDSSKERFTIARTGSDDMAAILFTSGSTGAPKGAVYSHGNFSAQVEALKQVYSIMPGEVDLPTFPLFALFAPALGMTAVIPEMDFTRPGSVNPEKIISAIRKYNVTTMFGSPALINRVGRYGAAGRTVLPSLKRVISAGAPVPAAVLERFSTMLSPETEIFTPYGATEALPVCSVGSKEILSDTRFITEAGGGICVGRPVSGIQLEIIKITDEPVACWSEGLKVENGEVGEIAVRGKQVTSCYYKRAEADLLAKIRLPDNSFFHRMGDLGRIDESGRVWFYGRKSHRVETADGSMFTIAVEAVFNKHPAVFRSALVGIGAKGNQRPVVCIETERDTKTKHEQLREELLETAAGYPHTSKIKTILFHPSFPVDIRHNAKIFREKLAVWAAGRVV